MWAAQNGNADVVKILSENRADINDIDNNGQIINIIIIYTLFS